MNIIKPGESITAKDDSELVVISSSTSGKELQQEFNVSKGVRKVTLIP